MAKHGPRKTFSVEKYMNKKGSSSLNMFEEEMFETETSLEPTPEASPSSSIAIPSDLSLQIDNLKADLDEIKTMLAPKHGEHATATGLDAQSDLGVRIQIAQMVREIGQAKTELAAIKHPHSEDDRIMAASNELDAIVLATESATNQILESNEMIEKELSQIAALAHDDQEILEIVDKIANHSTSVLEACNFQDITGQRINKVVNTMRFIEERILSMINIWGSEAFSDLPLNFGEDDMDEDEKLLEGPQLANEGISQSDIDKLFD